MFLHIPYPENLVFWSFCLLVDVTFQNKKGKIGLPVI